MELLNVTLEDKYALASGRVYLSGTQALVRLPMMQRQRDLLAGLNTAGFVSGYRGSPLGGVDKESWRAQKFLDDNHIVFKPGVNEDLAATAIWGTQQLNLFEGAKYDGVFAMWYGKGPGVDRSGDVFKHGNYSGTSRHGGVLVVAGDDPVCKSSTLPSQTEYAFMDAQIPVLNPSNVQEILDFGLIGWAMSRYSGCWVALKTIPETVDASASVFVDPDRVPIVMPEDFEMPPDGLHVRFPDPPLEQEERLQRHKLYAALAFVRANGLDKVVIDSPKARFGIATTGKSYPDVMQALDDLGIGQAEAAEIGLRVYKVAMPWPLEREGIRRFAEGLDEVLVVEEKRGVVENQFKEQLYNWRPDVRPRVVGKFDETDEWILPSAGELTPARVARAIANRIERFHTSPRVKERLAILEQKERALAGPRPDITRSPYFCSGCPHNTSTRVPEGSRALAGIGCHYMAQWMDRETATYSHMGGEGVAWVGQSPFTETDHVFVNLGDGTYYHSGLLAIRAAVGGDVNITYKILFNDAVAMTGGQPLGGPTTVPLISHQVAAEGVKRVAVVSDEPDKYPLSSNFAPGTTFHHRDDLDRLQRDLREWPGVSVLIYDQTCAAEKRRRRKRGLMADPPRRVFINSAVCEGCGDCSMASNCVSVVPVETEFGRKRAIDQSACNKDFSCLKGFCPSFVTVHGGALRKRSGRVGDASFPVLPEPEVPEIGNPYGIVVTGIGGTGVVTIGALLGMAGHLEGRGVSILDMTGLAQKNGAVVSHLRFAKRPEDLHAARITAGGADLLLGCDIVAAGSLESLAKLRAGHSRAVVNTHKTMTAEFTQRPDMEFPEQGLIKTIVNATGDDGAVFVGAGSLATAILGDSIATNLFVVGYAWQKGLVPLRRAAIERAIELNGVAVDFNKQAFLWGRRAAHDLAAVQRAAMPERQAEETAPASLDDIIARRMGELTAYQDAAYAKRYSTLVGRVRDAETKSAKGLSGLAEAVARSYFKLLAYKDEYEVARLHSDGSFMKQVHERFEGDFKLTFHLAPPLVASRNAESAELQKRVYESWMMGVFKVLARLKGLRGTPFDVFGYGAERRMERRLIGEYETTVEEILGNLGPDTHGVAVDIAALPETMRGFGHVKERNVAAAKASEAELFDAFRNPERRATAAE